MNMFSQKKPRKIYNLETRVAELQALFEAERRRREVAEAETEAMAAVISRDRMRVLAETAAYARQRADHELDQERLSNR